MNKKIEESPQEIFQHTCKARLATFDEDNLPPELVETPGIDAGSVVVTQQPTLEPFSNSYKIASVKPPYDINVNGAAVLSMDGDSQILIQHTDAVHTDVVDDQWIAPFRDAEFFDTDACGSGVVLVEALPTENYVQQTEKNCLPQGPSHISAVQYKSPGNMLRSAAFTVHAVVKMTRAERMRRKAKWATKKLIVFILSHVGLTTLVGLYAVAGGFLFQYLEGKTEKPVQKEIPKLDFTDIRQRLIDNLWNYTNDVNVLYPTIWKDKADDIMREFENELMEMTGFNKPADNDTPPVTTTWTYPRALLFSVTIITTIGYGDTVPKTMEGKVATILYAVIGIPLVLLCLTNLGSFLATLCRFTWKHTSHLVHILLRSPKRNIPLLKTSEVKVPITLSVLTMVIYILSGATIFSRWENWTFLDGSYFCFITLSTIGFGDFVPGQNTKTLDSNAKRVVCALYLLFGLALLSMIFQLIQDSFTVIVRRYASFLGLSDKQIQREMEESADDVQATKGDHSAVLPGNDKVKATDECVSSSSHIDMVPSQPIKPLQSLGRQVQLLRRESCPVNHEGLVYKETLSRMYSMPARNLANQFRLKKGQRPAAEKKLLEPLHESQSLDNIKEKLYQQYSINADKEEPIKHHEI